jgi:hypothetical protein
MRMERAFSIAMLTIATSLFASEAPAQNVSSSTKACSQAARHGQLLRDEGKLVEARAAFVECAQPSCPKVVMKDCSQWQGEIDQRTPTIVVAARDSTGQRLVDVNVRVDGKPFATKLDGRSLPINPGKRNIAFEADGYTSVEQEIVVLEGVRARVVEVTMVSTNPPPPPPEGDAKTVKAPDETERRGTNIAPWVLAGIGVVGIGTFTALALGINGDYAELEKSCKPNCTDDQVSPLRSRATISYVALGIGAAAAVTSVILFTTSSRSGSVSLRARPGLSYAGLELSGSM